MDSLGESLHKFIQDCKGHFQHVKELQWRAENPDLRPKWKIHQDVGECDVVSIQENIEELLHPRERARRLRGYQMYTQQYLKSGWVDVNYLKSLKKSDSLLLAQSSTSPKLQETVNSNYEAVIKFLKKLEARRPLYDINFYRYRNRKEQAKAQEITLNRIQYRTKRLMAIALHEAIKLRKEGKVAELSKLVENFMGDYMILKTNRVAPWKFEYLNEIYNNLGLAYLNELIIPSDLDTYKGIVPKLKVLLNVKVQEDSFVEFVFGQRHTWSEPGAIDYGLIKYK